jgi:hypothetical protein
MCEPPLLSVSLATPAMCQTANSAAKASELIERFLATGFFEPCDDCNAYTQGLILHAPLDCIDDLPAELLEYVRALTPDDGQVTESDDEIPF